MNMILKNSDLKCKKHMNITGELMPGKANNIAMYFITFPYLLWHQIVCVDNPLLHATSKRLHEQFKTDPNWYAKSIKRVEIKTRTIKQTLIEKII